ncbi:MAG: Flagellar biosynthesis protein FliO, partial [Frankiales bacterium]|nr:Flagellar biosynthesis protein FliO [Frankiales bacterium]
MVVLGLLLRVACVFALLFAVLAVLKRTEGFRAARRTNPVQVLGSTRVGKGAALTMVRIGDAEYVLGVTDHSVTLITPATPVEQPAAVEEPVAAVAGPKPDF